MERVPRNESPPQRRRQREEKAVVNFGLNPSVITQAASFSRKRGCLQSVAWIEDQKICLYNFTVHTKMRHRIPAMDVAWAAPCGGI